MPCLEFEELTEKNVHEAINVCNASLRYDAFNAPTMRRVTFQDPNFEAGLALIA